MPNAPVVFDDGGSTRIKHLKDNKNMDGLLGRVDSSGNMVFSDQADGPFVQGGAFKCRLRIRYHEEDGSHHILPAAPAGGEGGIDLAQTDTVTIVSENGQKAVVKFGTDNKMTITLSTVSDDGAAPTPIVEAKQNKRQRRYVVSNAGLISTISVTPDGGAERVIFKFVDTPSIYTMLHLTDKS